MLNIDQYLVYTIVKDLDQHHKQNWASLFLFFHRGLLKTFKYYKMGTLSYSIVDLKKKIIVSYVPTNSEYDPGFRISIKN
jgi:hypothetical protein